ncbi:MAG: ATP-binding protein, partial [Anaerolineae bacterium]
MTRTLAFKLLLAFLIVAVAGAVLAALFARWATYEEFDRLVLEQAQENFMAEAVAYYEANGSWQGVRAYFQTRAPVLRPGSQPASPPQGGQPSSGQPRPAQPPYVFALIDARGRVVLPAGPYHPGDPVADSVLAEGVAIEVDGQVVGTALATGDPPELSVQEQRYLDRTNLASLYAAVAAIVVALVLGAFLARTLTRPVRELTAATRAMARGDLEQQVPVRSQDELGELAASFNRMSADLARANESRRQMTADIAHDLRTPLSVIAGYTEGLRDGVLSPSAETFETMHVEAAHLRRLIEDLRTLSLADAGELALMRQPTMPQELLARTAAAHLPHARQREVSLEVAAAHDLPAIEVDPERMAQVLGNLVRNALRHTPAQGRITLGAGQQNGEVLLTVGDTGAGIAPENLPRIFDRFYRSNQAREITEGESGLGLAIAKSLVELHGGRIWVESVVGR